MDPNNGICSQRRKMGQSRMRIANWWYSRKDYSIAVKCYKKALQFYNNIPTNQVKFSKSNII